MNTTTKGSVSAMLAAKKAKKALKLQQKIAAINNQSKRHGKTDTIAPAQANLLQTLFCDRMVADGEMSDAVRDHYIEQMRKAHDDVVSTAPLEKAFRAFVYLESIMAAFQTAVAVIERAEPTLQGELTLGQRAISGMAALIQTISTPPSASTPQQRYAAMSQVRDFMVFAESYLNSGCLSESLLLKASGYGNAIRLCVHFASAFADLRYIRVLEHLIWHGQMPDDELLHNWFLNGESLEQIVDGVLGASVALYLCAVRTEQFKDLPYDLTTLAGFHTPQWQALAADNFAAPVKAASASLVTVMDPFENKTGLKIMDSFALGVQILEIQQQLRSRPS